MGKDSRGWLVEALGIFAILICGGCSALTGGDQAAATPPIEIKHPEFVDDVARPQGLKYVLADSVGLVTNLDHTGSDPPPSARRTELLQEMKVRKVHNPTKLLASDSTALVIVRGYIPPGARLGDRFDLEVITPAKTGVKSLRCGWLMESVLREHINVAGDTHSGSEFARGEGSILVRSAFETGDDPVMETRGVILGGGIVKASRNIGLLLRKGHDNIRTSELVADAINHRFHMYYRGNKKGVANALDDAQIEILVHPSYRENLIRYVRVIQSVPVFSRQAGAMERLNTLKLRLMRPSSSVRAALQLEALGEDGLPILIEALKAENTEVRFYAAEALAYQDQDEAAPVLLDIARHEPAFRYRSLVALGSMGGVAGHEGLIELLDEESAELRYGAFRMLRKDSAAQEPMIAERPIDSDFHLHVVPSNTTPLVHVATQERAEIVIFGTCPPLRAPLLAFAGTRIVVRSDAAGKVVIKKLSSGEEDEVRQIGADLAGIIQAIAEAGGHYADVVQFLNDAQRGGSLAARLEFSAIPELNRTFDRDETAAESPDSSEESMAPFEDITRLDAILDGEAVSSQDPAPITQEILGADETDLVDADNSFEISDQRPPVTPARPAPGPLKVDAAPPNEPDNSANGPSYREAEIEKLLNAEMRAQTKAAEDRRRESPSPDR